VDRGPGFQIVSSTPKNSPEIPPVVFPAPSTARFFLLSTVVVVVVVVVVVAVTNKLWINLQ